MLITNIFTLLMANIQFMLIETCFFLIFSNKLAVNFKLK